MLSLMVIAICCLLIGYGVGRRRARKQLGTVKKGDGKLRCECSHLYTSHKTKKPYPCTALTDRKHQCSCKHYYGPAPVPTLNELWPDYPKAGE